jgi:DNA-binding MarR family transcriptional regulator
MKTDANAELLYLDRQLCFKLYTASRLMTRAYQPMLKALSITYPQYLVLMVLWELEGKGQIESSLGDLGQRLQLDSGTLTPLLKRLQSRQLIDRQRSERDERQLLIKLTPEGLALEPRARAWVAEAVANSDVSERLLEDLQKNLAELVDVFHDNG